MKKTAKTAKACFFWLVLIFLILAQTKIQAQIQLEDEYLVGEKIIATINYPIPEGSKLQLLWNNSPELNTEVSSNQEKLCIWGKSRKEPYKIDVIVIPLKTITVEGQTFDVITGAIQRFDKSFIISSSDPPNPTIVPFPTTGFTVLILKEAKETGQLPVQQKAIFTSSKILGYLNENTIKLSDNHPAYRIWDDDYSSSQLSNVPKILQDAYGAAKKDSTANNKLPWIVISTGVNGYSGPLPNTVDETLTLLEKYVK